MKDPIPTLLNRCVIFEQVRSDSLSVWGDRTGRKRFRAGTTSKDSYLESKEAR